MKKTMNLKVGYLPISKASWMSPIIEKCAADTLAELQKLGCEIVSNGIVTDELEALAQSKAFKADGVDAVVLHFVSFPIGAAVPAAVHDIEVPVILLANPEEPGPGRIWMQNSFCGANMAAFDMNRMKRKYAFVMASPEETAAKVSPILGAVRMMRCASELRIGLVGGRVPGFYTSNFDEMFTRRLFNTAVEVIDVVEIIELSKQASGAELEDARRTVKSSASASGNAEEKELEQGARLLAGFRAAAKKYNVGTFAVRCWPEFSDLFGVAPCAILGMLSNEGLISSCEGDVYGAITMKLLEAAAGEGIPFFMDLIKFDYAKNQATVWHCGATPSGLCRNFAETRFCKHMRVDGGDKKGLTNEFSLKAGAITLAKFDTDADAKPRMLLATGDAIDTEPFLRGNPLNIVFHQSVEGLINMVMKRGFEHHYALIHSNVKTAVEQYCEWMNIEVCSVK